MSRILITVPVWNEEACLALSLERLVEVCSRLFFDHDWMIEVVDNGSTDRTAEIVRIWEQRDSHVKLRMIHERGKGGAIIASWLAHQMDKDIFVFVDADLAPDVERLRDLVAPLLRAEADVVCGVRGSLTLQRTWWRSFLSRVYRYWQRLVLCLPFSDVQCGFKAVSLRVVQDILPLLKEKKWLFDSELLAFVVSRGWLISALPIAWIERRFSSRRSALHVFSDGWEFVFGVWRIRRRVFKKKLSTETS